MNKRTTIIALIIVVVVLPLLVIALFNSNDSGSSGQRSSRHHGGVVGVIHIGGTIASGSDASSLFSVMSGSETIMEQLRAAGDKPDLKAVVLRLDTPGGSAAASQEIALEVDRLRKKDIVVVASMGDIAASGGYWIACHCDKIVANPGTITGSIGVIMETQNLQGLYEKLGVDPMVFKSGPYKDMGSSSRVITEQEQYIFQGMVDDIYEQFVSTVAEGRGLEIDQVRKLADGRVFTGNQAVQNGLVDKLGNYYDAIDLAAELSGIEGEPQVVELSPTYTFWDMLGSSSSFSSDLILDKMAERTADHLLDNINY